MKIGKRHKAKHYCKSKDEVVDILNTQYEELHVRGIDWYTNNCDSSGTINVPCDFVRGMKDYLGRNFNSFRAYKRPNYIRIEPTDIGWSWSLQMFEEFDDFIIEEE